MAVLGSRVFAWMLAVGCAASTDAVSLNPMTGEYVKTKRGIGQRGPQELVIPRHFRPQKF